MSESFIMFLFLKKEGRMKKHFFLHILLILFVAHTVSLAYPERDEYEQVECVITRMASRKHNSHPHIPGPSSETRATGQTTSTNWAGYAAVSSISKPAKNSVSAVFGSWIVPAIVPANQNTYSAIWIGIDGYTSSTVEQIGTGHDFVGGVAQHYAWFEMYPGGSYSIDGFPLKPGDVISASINYSVNNIFTMILYNNTQKVSTTIPISYTTSATAQRSSAEWIVEAPWLNSVLPLTDFVTAYLWGCMATINGVTGSISNPKWPNVSIEMVTSAGAPKAVTSALLQDNGSFFVTWAHA